MAIRSYGNGKYTNYPNTSSFSIYENVNTVTARWLYCEDKVKLEQFKREQQRHLALDGADQLTYLAPSRVNLDITQEHWPDIQFSETREH